MMVRAQRIASWNGQKVTNSLLRLCWEVYHTDFHEAKNSSDNQLLFIQRYKLALKLPPKVGPIGSRDAIFTADVVHKAPPYFHEAS
jgi:hypothetical protein